MTKINHNATECDICVLHLIQIMNTAEITYNAQVI